MPEDVGYGAEAMGGGTAVLDRPPMLVNSEQIVSSVYREFKEAEGHKRGYAKDWIRYYLLYASKHWQGTQPSWMSTPVINLVFSAIETMVPILTHSNPQIAVAPQEPQDEAIASVIGKLLECIWEANDMSVKLPKIVRNMLIFGNGFVKILWNQDLRKGLGDIDIVPVDPSHIFFSPFSKTLQESEYVIHAENLPKRFVKRLFPGVDLEDEVGPQVDHLTIDRTATSRDNKPGALEKFRLTDGSAVEDTRATEAGSQDNQKEDLVTVIERWSRREGGQVFQTVVVNQKLVIDRPAIGTNGRFPFVHFVDYQTTWSAWALGEVQAVDQLQISINRRRGHIQDILRYTASPMLVVDPASGLEYENIRPRPNLVLPAEGGLQSVGWVQPPGIPNSLFEANSLDKEDFEMILGRADVQSGTTPPGVEAGYAIQLLQEAANVRMQLKVRNLENAIKQIGEILIGFIQEFYTTERVFRVVGFEIAKLQQPFTKDSFIAINQPSGGMAIGEDGEPGPAEVLNEIPPIGSAEFDVRIGPGSTLPISRIARFTQVMEMFAAGIVDDEEVLKNSGLPHWDEILVRNRMWRQQMAMQEQAAAAAQGPNQVDNMSDSDADLAMEAEAGAQPPEEFA